MLYSVGKDSAVMLHLARKAFYPVAAAVPAAARRHDVEVPGDVRAARPLAREAGMELLVHQNPEARGARHQPVRPRRAPHRHVEDRRAEAGARQVRLRRGVRRRPPRRGEEPRQGAHLLVPHRPTIAGTRRTSGPSCGTSTTPARAKGESIRVFPISNWTELDIWQYIHLEDIPIVPLYFAAPRPTVERDGSC